MNRSAAVGLVAAGLVAGLVIAGLNVASAQTSPTPSPGASAAPGGPGHGRRHHMGKGMLGALHGEFTTRAPGGGFQTMAMQRGQVTAVSATSVTVRSEDGFTRTYAIDDGTLVKAGDEGIADVATGDEVHVLAVVSGGSARAVHLLDVTKTGELNARWRPGRARAAA